MKTIGELSQGTFATNVVVVIALGIAWDLVRQKEPPQMGFFCHDATLAKPYVSARVGKIMKLRNNWTRSTLVQQFGSYFSSPSSFYTV